MSETKEVLSMLNVRMNRMESNMEKIADSMVTLAKAEERAVADREALKRLGDKIDTHDNRIRLIEDTQNRQAWLYNLGQGGIKQILMTMAAGLAVVAGAGYFFSQ